MEKPRRIWWPRPRKLCVLERPGGGGRSHRPARREAELDWLEAHGMRLIVSTMGTRHNIPEYERRGLEFEHVPVASAAEGADALERLLALLRREHRRGGAVAIHGNRHTDFVAAVGAAHLQELKGVDPVKSLRAAVDAGLTLTDEACALLGLDSIPSA